MASLRRLVLTVTAIALAACARTVPVASSDGATAAPRADVDRWTASLRQPTMTNTAVIGGASPGAVAASYGSVTLTQPRGAGSGRIELTVTIPAAANRQVAWALFTGSCTTASPPVVPVNELQPIDLDASGSGAVRGGLPATLDPNTTYNLRVYSGPRATDVNNVVLCSRLGFSGKR